jgi:hypothetical protein
VIIKDESHKLSTRSSSGVREIFIGTSPSTDFHWISPGDRRLFCSHVILELQGRIPSISPTPCRFGSTGFFPVLLSEYGPPYLTISLR